MAQLPKILKDYNILVDGTSFMGRSKSFRPPQIRVEREAARYSGMDGKVQHDMGLEELEAQLKMGELAPELARLVGTIHEVPIVVYGYAEASPGGETQEVVMTMRGRILEQSTGDIESGRNTDHDFVIACSAYRETIGGETTKDIDVLSNRRVIGGVDVLADKRRILKSA